MVGALLLYSCHKVSYDGDVITLTDPNTALDLAGAKKFYLESLKEQSNAVTDRVSASVMSIKKNNTKHVIFRKGYSASTRRAWFVEAPLVYEQRSNLFIIMAVS
ncbi:hypothetical protein [Mucilaginibacter terrae]|uniref:hypothetical protein n=1 Tax=Mucilaginibacter terrae TaxID=1955052 RepID=UPI003670A1D2